MDAVDHTILTVLMEDGRATWADLAEAAGLSAPAVAERVRRLEDRGAISGYAALERVAGGRTPDRLRRGDAREPGGARRVPARGA